MAGSDQMKPEVPRVRLTYDDFVLFPDDGNRHELIDGEHYVTPSPVPRHQAILWNLVAVLAPYLETHPVGRAFTAPLDVLFSDFDVVEPDLLYISRERLDAVLTAKNVAGAPDLVVEIGSPGTRKRDETTKRRLYEHFGVSEYWVVDPEIDTVKVFRQTGAGYTRVAELALEQGDVLTTPLLPGLELPLARIFKDE
jgi:Uma2 family endonuclease